MTTPLPTAGGTYVVTDGKLARQPEGEAAAPAKAGKASRESTSKDSKKES